jgi:hypothetical protein
VTHNQEEDVYLVLFNEAPFEAANMAARPRLLSIRGIDASTLTLIELDLRACIFEGAYHLDKLRIEGSSLFANPPRGWQLVARQS